MTARDSRGKEWDAASYFTVPIDPGGGPVVATCLEYDATGKYLAVGDNKGRIMILERKDGAGYNMLFQFQSHEVAFDCLKSIEILEKINKIRWLEPYNSSHLLLAANDKVIKLWKVAKAVDRQYGSDVQQHSTGVDHFVTCRKAYHGAHAYYINSVSLNSDCQTFLSSDELRVQLWHLEHDNTMNIVDLKPEAMEELTEVITTAVFHPTHCSQYVYSTSKGVITIGDLRSLQDGLSFSAPPSSSIDPFFSDLLRSVSDVSYLGSDGRYLVSRDFLTLKVWDTTMSASPLAEYAIHDGLRPHLCELYDNDSIFEKFECTAGVAGWAATGSYRNEVRIFDIRTEMGLGEGPAKPPATVEVAKTNSTKRKKRTSMKVGLKRLTSRLLKVHDREAPASDHPTYEPTDFLNKTLHLAAHPSEKEFAAASHGNIVVFTS
eukprot:Sspe_Gene.98961::Locus_72362_Transcript_1_2_Confidence_0.667_Length_1391::g.98961::m.98961/K04354/PPP2R2; serine/threonine-protein phosphatase 2A regulatory subunit B